MESHSNFSSARANACVYAGKWMYEVVLGTGGIQQIGWATLDCRFSNENGMTSVEYPRTGSLRVIWINGPGVGDSPDSYAYDGARIKKWTNSRDAAYGHQWLPGDIIGVCIDLPLPDPGGEPSADHLTKVTSGPAEPSVHSQASSDDMESEGGEVNPDKSNKGTEDDDEEDNDTELFGCISFYRNGEPLGIAFRNVRVGPGIAYFPTISLSFKERSLLNLGGKPFYFPVPGYLPQPDCFVWQ